MEQEVHPVVMDPLAKLDHLDLREQMVIQEPQGKLDLMAMMVSPVPKGCQDVLAPQGQGVLLGTVVPQVQAASLGHLAFLAKKEHPEIQDLQACREHQVCKATQVHKVILAPTVKNRGHQVQWEYQDHLATKELQVLEAQQASLARMVRLEKTALMDRQALPEHPAFQVRLGHQAT
jgi:hypothetical protein